MGDTLIVMPLFEFESDGIDSFQFGYDGLSLEPLTSDDIIECPLFSKQDIRLMRTLNWALVYDASDIKNYKPVVNLLLLAFRIFSDDRPPFIKYRICQSDATQNFLLGSPMTHNDAVNKPRALINKDKLTAIDEGFDHLQRMEGMSNRTLNALYFLHRAFHTDKWLDSFLLMMTSLEALFSKDEPGWARGTLL